MVMTFVFTPLCHYNSIIDVYRDMATRDKLIFLSAITWILHHFSVPIPNSPYYTVMDAINSVSVWRSKVRL